IRAGGHSTLSRPGCGGTRLDGVPVHMLLLRYSNGLVSAVLPVRLPEGKDLSPGFYGLLHQALVISIGKFPELFWASVAHAQPATDSGWHNAIATGEQHRYGPIIIPQIFFSRKPF